MNDTTDAASTAETQAPAEQAKPEMKSTDTGVLSALKADTANPPAPDAKSEIEKPGVQPDSHATSAGKEADAGSSEAEHQGDERIEPWMRKRLSRAEENGRKLGRAEILDEIRLLRGQPDPAKPTESSAPDQPAQAKTLADFDYDVEKFTQHQIREGVKAALTERDAEQERQRQERTAEEARTAFEKRKADFEKRAGEGAWDEMVSARVDVPQEVIDLLAGHPRDLDIAHYLVRHADELEKLRGKSRLEMARTLSTIEAKLSGSNTEELPPKTTKAPPPPPSIQGAGKSVKSIQEMSTAERIAEWRRQKQQRQA